MDNQDTANDAIIVTCSSGSFWILPLSSEVRIEPVEDDLTDCESPNKQPGRLYIK